MKIPVGIPIFIAAAGTDPRFAKLVYRYLLCSTVWLLLASVDGVFMSVRLFEPDLLGAHEWLFHGRIRPVHVLTMLFGWLSLGLVGLSFYVVSKASRVTMSTWEIRVANAALVLWNLGVLAGGVALPLGLTTAREYREYPVWVIAPIAVAVVMVGWVLLRIVGRRAVRGVYISCWFIVAACFWVLIVVIVGWIPVFRVGLADTITQGYYMHNAVGMWFTPLAVGLTYYTLPKLLNKPIYSYGLGVLGFFTHLVFYTVIGTHHFTFSPLPGWLQGMAIIFSVAMVVPVFASSGNFLLTMKGERTAISHSYSLPFLVVGVVAYLLSSVQGSVQALPEAQKAWHLTHYTVGHSHAAMYGFVSFLLWGSVYGLLPRVTAKEPPVLLVGVHFWLALLGLGVYVIAMWSAGDTQGAAWRAGDVPFSESFRGVVPQLAWRAVGGTLMLAGHVVFAVNLWKMRPGAFTMAFGAKGRD